MSHFLAFRFIKDEGVNFYAGLKHEVFKPVDEHNISLAKTSSDIEKSLKQKINEFYLPGKTAILLSGGIDSAILASYLPKGTRAYTFQCIADGAIDERSRAKQYCDKYGLEQKIINIEWSDFEELTPKILQADGVPFHSIEVQLLKACSIAKSESIERIIIGDAADYNFGGMNKILSKDWEFDEFINRYNAVNPEIQIGFIQLKNTKYSKFNKEDIWTKLSKSF